MARMASNEQRANIAHGLTDEQCMELPATKWNTPGWNIDDIDWDSKLRVTQMECLPHHKLQLPKRVFTAAPSLNRGQPRSQKRELNAWTGTDTSWINDCSYKNAEVNYNRWDPGLCPVSVKNIVSDSPRGGVSSRDISRQVAFKRLHKMQN
jgi:hypothetical protein